MVVTQGSDEDVRAGTRLNKQITNFETPVNKSERGCERGGFLVRGEKNTQTRSERWGGGRIKVSYLCSLL